MMTFDAIRAMTTEDIKSRVRELSYVLDACVSGDDWDRAYTEYGRLNAVLDERYREENQAEFDAFYEKHIKGKQWEEIDPDAWQCYSDWHKDMYGFRPKCI